MKSCQAIQNRLATDNERKVSKANSESALPHGTWFNSGLKFPGKLPHTGQWEFSSITRQILLTRLYFNKLKPLYWAGLHLARAVVRLLGNKTFRKVNLREQDKKTDSVLSAGINLSDTFGRLLRWLDGGADSHGQKYEAMRKRLVEYFERKNCLAPEDLADETFNRVMKWLEQQGKDTDPEPAKICYNTARFVFQESLRKPERLTHEVSELTPAMQPSEDPRTIAGLTEDASVKEKRLTCLERCMQNLSPSDQQLIVRYYYGEQRVKLENRKALADELGLTPNALNIKTSRIREKLRVCVTTCTTT